MELATHFQVLDETDSVSLCANAFGKGMNQFVLLLAMGK